MVGYCIVAAFLRYLVVVVVFAAMPPLAACGSTIIPACENDEECASFQCPEGQEATCEIPSGDIFGICGCVASGGSGGTGGDGGS